MKEARRAAFLAYARRFHDESTMGIHEAIALGKAALALDLAGRIPEFDELDRHGYAPIARAAYAGMTEVVARLAERGADLTRQSHGVGLLIDAFAREEVLTVLLDHGMDPNARNDYFGYRGITALHAASLHGFPGSARILLRHGADVNAVTEEGVSALMFAVMRPHCEAWLEIMHEQNAGVGFTDQNGQDALILAINTRQGEDVIERLLERGANPHRQDALERSAYDYAVARGDLSESVLAKLQ